MLDSTSKEEPGMEIERCKLLKRINEGDMTSVVYGGAGAADPPKSLSD